ncbi:hypothetical protein L3X38_010953 [Prunus dulcis]|uniref:Uncharacterized protein n=1 Tax=Prunus dulcis TaxID=3755 RepID=A0AAD4WIQ4_PRUDU|nr:hypothetical protein L3X38_010953 [Prunus dulcis]
MICKRLGFGGPGKGSHEHPFIPSAMISLRQGQWHDFSAVKLGYILARSYNPCCSVASASGVSSKGLCMAKQGGGSFGKVTKSFGKEAA